MRYNIELKKELEDQGMTQTKLSKKIGCQHSIISMIIRGRLIPSEVEKNKIADALKVKVSKIFVSN